MRYSRAAMTEGPLLKSIILYTIPIILTSVLQLLFNAADLVVVGRFCGSVSVAAVGATGSLINLIVNLFIGLSVGAGVSTAQAIGAGDQEKVHRIVHTAIPTAAIGGLALTAFGVFFARDALALMGTPEDVIDLSAVYMRIYFCGMVPNMLYNFGASVLRAAGDTKSPLYFLTAAGVLNVLLNLVFVMALHMDVAGVALATALTQTLSAVLVLLALAARTDGCRLMPKRMKLYGTELKEIVRIGLPAGIQGSLFSISNVLIQSSVNSFGSVVMSGNAATQNIEGFVYVSMNAFHQTALNFTGQNYGAGLHKRIRKIMLLSLACVAVTGLFAGVSAWLMAKPLLSIYITDSAEAISYGVIRMSFINLPYFLCGIMDVTTGAIRGMGASLLPMIVSVMGICVFRVFWIFCVFGQPQFHSLECLYLSYPISWIITFAAQITIFSVLNRRNIKKARESSPA
ncbi:MAG: MATE family efflux transporter [Clostridia bacterium]|nr:MATE family efflux transporter [Clostridia bacterium]